MKQIWIVLKQEYLNRIRKRSFVVLTLLGPVLSLCMLFIPVYLSLNTNERIHVWLQTANIRGGNFTDETFVFHHIEKIDVKEIEQEFLQEKSEADVLATYSIDQKQIVLWDKKGLSAAEQWKLKNKIQDIYVKDLVATYLPERAVAPQIQYIPLAEEIPHTDILQVAGLFCAIIIYFFIFYYGVQVMKGIVDEKVNRVVEVILCSVKPFHWMMGKILGIAAVCLTQFGFWTMIYVWIGSKFNNRYGEALTQFNDKNIQDTLHVTTDAWQALEWNVYAQGFESLPLLTIGISFFAYFILGYLLYASLFAAVGAMTDNETDTQQFTFPITAPLFITFLFAGLIISAPDSQMSMILSYFPLTSPVAMMLRIPFGVSVWEIVASVAILLTTFIFVAYQASQVFKRGVLQYGKAMSWKDVFSFGKK
ncbi:ABC transporter permease [Cytophaga aurantiaca]|uniref:ABC transporter permease n=1 Tax=Cytophaga aurantiaca TaxID=29530 RepID=UPI00037C0D79|nr:ABC transporter permease [Cytophaga aurantiaca]